MSSSDSSRNRPLLPAPAHATQRPTPPPPPPRSILPRQPRVGVSIACESCRKRKIRVRNLCVNNVLYLTVSAV